MGWTLKKSPWLSANQPPVSWCFSAPLIIRNHTVHCSRLISLLMEGWGAYVLHYCLMKSITFNHSQSCIQKHSARLSSELILFGFTLSGKITSAALPHCLPGTDKPLKRRGLFHNHCSCNRKSLKGENVIEEVTDRDAKDRVIIY